MRWRNLLARLPLPMLALSASYGVYSFAALYVPVWVAIVQAAAFELTYIGLAVAQGLHAAERRRATAISVGAVVVSILYNSLAGLFHRNPAWLAALPWYGEVVGAVLHGAPLAWVAYLVADLLLHSAVQDGAPNAPSTQDEIADAPMITEIPPPALPDASGAAPALPDDDARLAEARRLIATGASQRAAAAQVGLSESTLRRRLAAK